MSVEHLSQVVYNSELKMHQICDADATKKQSLIIGDWFYFVFLVSLALFTNSLDSFYPWNETVLIAAVFRHVRVVDLVYLDETPY
jgi:hypothetical protein